MKRVKIEMFESNNGTTIYISNNEDEGIHIGGSLPEITSRLIESCEVDVDELMQAVSDMAYTISTGDDE